MLQERQCPSNKHPQYKEFGGGESEAYFLKKNLDSLAKQRRNKAWHQYLAETRLA